MARLIVSVFCFTFLLMSASYALDSNERLNTGIQSFLRQNQKTYEISLPRNDLNVVVNGMKLSPAMGLTSKIVFQKVGEEVMLSGDLILLQDQVNPVMSTALNQGLEVTDLHNPFLWDSPRVMLMHIQGKGDALQLTARLQKVLSSINATKDGNGDFPLANLGDTAADLNVMTINNILGVQGKFIDGIYKIRFDQFKKAPSNSWVTFSGSNENALMDGILVVRASELQSVLKTLRGAQIYIVAIYQQIVLDDPDFIFVHYWGMGDVGSLARTLQKTLLLAENHTAPRRLVAVEKPAEVFPFMQNKHCDMMSRWVKNLYPLVSPPVQAAETLKIKPVEVSSRINLFTIKLTSLLNKAEERVNTYLVHLAITWIKQNSRDKQTIAARDFYNEGRVSDFLSVSLHKITSAEADYHYVAKLQKMFPITFSIKSVDISMPAAVKAIQEPAHLAKGFSNQEKISHAVASALKIVPPETHRGFIHYHLSQKKAPKEVLALNKKFSLMVLQKSRYNLCYTHDTY